MSTCGLLKIVFFKKNRNNWNTKDQTFETFDIFTKKKTFIPAVCNFNLILIFFFIYDLKDKQVHGNRPILTLFI